MNEQSRGFKTRILMCLNWTQTAHEVVFSPNDAGFVWNGLTVTTLSSKFIKALQFTRSLAKFTDKSGTTHDKTVRGGQYFLE